jgi:DNA polymerase/3'-5' exonuclease PolX
MSEGRRWPRAKLLPIAGELMRDLERLGRVELAGSLRRGDDDAGDIDLVVQPRDLRMDVRYWVRSWGPITKGGARYLQVMHYAGCPVDVYVVRPPAQWGVILAARIGPAELWLKAKEELKKYGMYSQGGCIHKGAGIVPCPDEQTFYKLAGLPYSPPEQR